MSETILQTAPQQQLYICDHCAWAFAAAGLKGFKGPTVSFWGFVKSLHSKPKVRKLIGGHRRLSTKIQGSWSHTQQSLLILKSTKSAYIEHRDITTFERTSSAVWMIMFNSWKHPDDLIWNASCFLFVSSTYHKWKMALPTCSTLCGRHSGMMWCSGIGRWEQTSLHPSKTPAVGFHIEEA